MHIMNDTAHVQGVLTALHASYASSPLMSQFVDIHLVIDSFDRQFNTWRNIARLFARTNYVMMLDVDFYLCTDFRDAILQSRPLMELLDEGQAAFVVPAFEYASHEDGMDYSKFPDDKEVRNLPVSIPRTDLTFSVTHLVGEIQENRCLPCILARRP